MTPPKILYIAGWSRGGSTLLDRALGAADGWFSCGELRLIWLNFTCGCGTPVFDCEFWTPILREVLAKHDLDRAGVEALRGHWFGSDRRTVGAFVRGNRKRDRSAPMRRYAALLTDLYEAIARATGARVLVDSSKTAGDAYLIGALTDLELYVVHLVRDPRGAAYSWRRKKRSYRPDVYLPTMSPTRSSIRWLRRNAAIEALVRPRQGERYVRIKYEDFARRPRGIVRSLCSLVDEPDADLPFAGENQVTLEPNHTVGGNPVRFSRGELVILPDDEWKVRMDARSRVLATIPALPLLPRYGYRLARIGHRRTSVAA